MVTDTINDPITAHGYRVTLAAKVRSDGKAWIVEVWFGAEKRYELVKRFATFGDAHDVARSLLDHHKGQIKSLINDMKPPRKH